MWHSSVCRWGQEMVRSDLRLTTTTNNSIIRSGLIAEATTAVLLDTGFERTRHHIACQPSGDKAALRVR